MFQKAARSLNLQNSALVPAWLMGFLVFMLGQFWLLLQDPQFDVVLVLLELYGNRLMLCLCCWSYTATVWCCAYVAEFLWQPFDVLLMLELYGNRLMCLRYWSYTATVWCCAYVVGVIRQPFDVVLMFLELYGNRLMLCLCFWFYTAAVLPVSSVQPLRRS
jgi:hypothetical protein